MKIPAKLFIRFLLLIGLVIVLFSFAMFQGGFLSWFLFYSYIPFFLYYMLFIFYPLHKWKVDSNLSSRVVHAGDQRSEEHTSELQSRGHLVCRLLLEKK